MVWPKSKIHLVASSAAPGIAGVRAVLKASQLEFSEGEDLSEEIRENWWERPFDQMAEPEGSGPVTDVVFWSEGTEHSIRREKALAQGMNVLSIQSLIHNILGNDVILRVSKPVIFIQGRPLLWHILYAAGFEPTLLWETKDGEWQCERKQGIHWVIPESWQVSSGEAQGAEREAWATDLEPRPEIGVKERTSWVARDTGLDFYLAQDALGFVGQIPRWPEPMEERVAAETIARCLDLGVSWLDIRLALCAVWKNIILTDDLRWNINDIGRNAGTCGEELPSEPINHVEDWWACRDGVLASDKGRLSNSMATCPSSESSDLVNRAGLEFIVAR